MYTHTQQLFSIFFTSNIVDIHERDIVRENQTNRREPTEELGWILVVEYILQAKVLQVYTVLLYTCTSLYI